MNNKNNNENVLNNAPSRDFKYTKKLNEQLNKARAKAKSALNLAHILDLKKPLAEKALEEVNLNQGQLYTQLTQADLKRFAQKVRALKKDFTGRKIQGGITPNAIIARSRQIDIKRCQDEIHTVQAIRLEKDGVIHFRTNASKKYGATHHIVSVQFLNFQAALTAEKITNDFLNAYMKGAVKFDCDCGRHRFWYRYIATVGGFAYGTLETAFPKVRNPELTGLACKHVIRVMHTLARNPSALRQAVKMHIARYRKDPNQVAKTFTKKQVQQHTHRATDKAIRKPNERMLKEVSLFIKEKAKQMSLSTREKQMAKLGFMLARGEITEKDFQAASKKLLGK